MLCGSSAWPDGGVKTRWSVLGPRTPRRSSRGAPPFARRIPRRVGPISTSTMCSVCARNALASMRGCRRSPSAKICAKIQRKSWIAATVACRIAGAFLAAPTLPDRRRRGVDGRASSPPSPTSLRSTSIMESRALMSSMTIDAGRLRHDPSAGRSAPTRTSSILRTIEFPLPTTGLGRGRRVLAGAAVAGDLPRRIVDDPARFNGCRCACDFLAVGGRLRRWKVGTGSPSIAAVRRATFLSSRSMRTVRALMLETRADVNSLSNSRVSERTCDSLRDANSSIRPS